MALDPGSFSTSNNRKSPEFESLFFFQKLNKLNYPLIYLLCFENLWSEKNYLFHKYGFQCFFFSKGFTRNVQLV